MHVFFKALCTAVMAHTLFVPTLRAEPAKHRSGVAAPTQAKTIHPPAAPIEPPLPVPCTARDLKTESNFILDPEIHDCDPCKANREKLIEKATAGELFVGLEGSGEEPAIAQIAQLNDPESSAASLFFYALDTLEQHKQSPVPAEDLANEMDQIAFGLGQYEFLQSLLPAAISKASVGWAQKPATKKISDLFSALSNPKVPVEKKDQLWTSGKKTVLQNTEYVRAFLKALANEYISYLEKPENKQRLQPPDSQIYKNYVAHPLDLKAQTDTYKTWIIDWRNRSMAKTALKLICGAAGKDVYLLPGMNHGPGVYALLQKALKAAGLDKQVKTKVARTLALCPSYLQSRLNKDPDTLKYDAFLTSNK